MSLQLGVPLLLAAAIFQSAVLVRFRVFGGQPDLVLIGFIFNLAIWIDKIVFWFSEAGHHAGYLFYCFPIYDSVMFFSYLTTIPALALFLIRVETSFYTHYRDFYGDIMAKKPETRTQKKPHSMIPLSWT